MADVVGVIFQNGIKTYYFDPAGLELARGDRVVVQTMRGSEIGQVVEGLNTAPVLRDLSHRIGVELPITEGVCSVLDGRTTTGVRPCHLPSQSCR